MMNVFLLTHIDGSGIHPRVEEIRFIGRMVVVIHGSSCDWVR